MLVFCPAVAPLPEQANNFPPTNWLAVIELAAQVAFKKVLTVAVLSVRFELVVPEATS